MSNDETPHVNEVEDKGDREEEETFRLTFEDPAMETNHVRIKRTIAYQKKRETTTIRELDDDIRKAKEKGPSKMSVVARNLLKAKIEAAVEELRGTKLKKNELLDSIYDQLQLTVTHDMITEDLNRVERAEGKLEEERGDNNAKYEAWASKYLA